MENRKLEFCYIFVLFVEIICYNVRQIELREEKVGEKKNDRHHVTCSDVNRFCIESVSEQ